MLPCPAPGRARLKTRRGGGRRRRGAARWPTRCSRSASAPARGCPPRRAWPWRPRSGEVEEEQLGGRGRDDLQRGLASTAAPSPVASMVPLTWPRPPRGGATRRARAASAWATRLAGIEQRSRRRSRSGGSAPSPRGRRARRRGAAARASRRPRTPSPRSRAAGSGSRAGSRSAGGARARSSEALYSLWVTPVPALMRCTSPGRITEWLPMLSLWASAPART